MYCNNCGAPLDNNTTICNICGAQQSGSSLFASNTANSNHGQSNGHVHNGYVVGSSKSVGFLEAVKRAFQHYADFKGRARRSEYWWFTLFNIIATSVISAIVPDLAWIWSLAVLVPGVAIVVRRLHDGGRSGWFYLWILLPLAGYIIVLIQLLKDSAPDNQWGPNPKY